MLSSDNASCVSFNPPPADFSTSLVPQVDKANSILHRRSIETAFLIPIFHYFSAVTSFIQEIAFNVLGNPINDWDWVIASISISRVLPTLKFAPA